MTKNTFHNRTRTAVSIPKKLIAERKFHYLPLYAVLRTSTLTNEGMNNSGSYHFADHIYANRSKGQYGIGKLVDWTVLRLPSALDFRQRYVHAKKAIEDVSKKGTPQKILVAPAGLAREIFELADLLKKQGHTVHALDLDEGLVNAQNALAKEAKVPVTYHVGDVLEVSHYPEKSYDLIICMGLTEFLDDALATEVFKIFASKLSKNGVLYTSSTDIHPFSDKLLRNIADLHTNYRTQEQLHELLEHAGLEVDHSHVTKHKLQTIVRAKKK